jgi:uncharacterized membrane protein
MAKMIRCPSGHVYDSEAHASCPECARSGLAPSEPVKPESAKFDAPKQKAPSATPAKPESAKADAPQANAPSAAPAKAESPRAEAPRAKPAATEPVKPAAAPPRSSPASRGLSNRVMLIGGGAAVVIGIAALLLRPTPPAPTPAEGDAAQ